MSGSDESLSPQALEIVAKRFKILGDPFRLGLLQGMKSGRQSVAGLVKLTGGSQPNVSKHLKILFDAHLVARKQIGNHVYYEIVDPMVFELCETVCSRLRLSLEQQALTLQNEIKS